MDQLTQKSKDNIPNNKSIEGENEEENDYDLIKNDFKQEKSSPSSKVSKFII